MTVPRPYTLVAELTYRCPLRCPYCANPADWASRRDALDTDAWRGVIEQAAELGVVQLHLSGGEPLLRRDLEELVAAGRAAELYCNLVTSAVPLSRQRLEALAAAGLDAVQISVQDTEQGSSDRLAGMPSFAHKLEAARWVRELGLPLTLNIVLHAGNIERVAAMIDLAASVGADRLELANTQYLGWALHNRAALLPAQAEIIRARSVAREAAARLAGRMEILFVLPDYQAGRPRACMDGWGRRFLVVSPDGLVMPCHMAHTVPGVELERVGSRPLAAIWRDGAGMNAFRGEGWMKEPCRSCDRRGVDFGGCRCQAHHLTGDAAAADPACALAPGHPVVRAARQQAERRDAPVPLRPRGASWGG